MTSVVAFAVDVEKLRAQFIGRRTQLSNSNRGFAAEFGLIAPKGLSPVPDGS